MVVCRYFWFCVCFRFCSTLHLSGWGYLLLFWQVYAFGVIIYELLTGGPPYTETRFQNKSAIQLLDMIAAGARPSMSKIPSGVSRDLRRLIEDCWHQDPNQRPTMHGVLDRLRGNDPKLIFDAIDDDKSGSLDFGELIKFLQKYAKDVKPSEMAAIFEAIDVNGDQSISFDEFQQFWTIVQRNGLDNALKLVQRSRSWVS